MDPASGDQPLFNEDKSIIVTVNGEIYNYKASGAALEAGPGQTNAPGCTGGYLRCGNRGLAARAELCAPRAWARCTSDAAATRF